MSNLITQQFDGADIRIIQKDGEPWFVAKDIANALGYSNTNKAIIDHCKKQAKLGGNELLALDPQTIIIPESDVYRLIMRSKLPSAEKFEDWVTEEILPSIRKNGNYGKAPIDLLNDPVAMRGLLLGYSEKVLALESKVEAAKPAVHFYDTVANIEGLYNLQNAARALNKKPNLFIGELKKKYLFYQGGNLVAYSQYIKSGLFEIKVQVIEDKQRVQTFITARGLQFFDELYNDLFTIK